MLTGQKTLQLWPSRIHKFIENVRLHIDDVCLYRSGYTYICIQETPKELHGKRPYMAVLYFHPFGNKVYEHTAFYILPWSGSKI